MIVKMTLLKMVTKKKNVFIQSINGLGYQLRLLNRCITIFHITAI